MKNRNKIYLVFLLFLGILTMSSPAYSQLTGGVTFDFLGDASAAVTPVFEQIQTVADESIKFAREKLTALKASLGSYFSKRKNAAEKVPGTKKFAESSVDIYDPVAVQAAVNELFLQYPSKDPRINKYYEKEAVEFYYDTMIEIQTASKKLEEQLNSMRSEIDTFSKDAISPSGGTSGSMSSTDESGNYYNLYLAHKKFNDVLKITEEVMALYSQYYVARAIYRKTILPADYTGEDDKDGGSNKESKNLSSSRYFHSQIGLAQFVSGNVAAIAEKKEDTKDDELVYRKVSFTVPEAPEPQPLMGGNEEEFEALQNISEAQKYLNSAIEAHNVLRQLPEYKKLFQQYEMFKQLHNKAVEAVSLSDKCVVQYLGRRYKAPEKVWYGVSQAPADPTDYDNRSGLSGWSIAAFQVANADKSAGLDTDSFSTLDLGTDVSNTSVGKLDEIHEKVSKMDSSSALSSPSQEESFSEATREVELLVWQIGAQAAKILAEDQYSSSPAYGRAENPYPLWQDQKSFYNQYIDGKYENMANYIRQLDLTNIALKIAQIINDDKDDGMIKSSAQRGLTRLSSYLNKKEKRSQKGNPLVEEKEIAVSKIDNEKSAALSSYKKAKQELLEQLDEVTSKISTMNDEISKADSDAATGKAKTEVSYNTLQLMNKRGNTEDSTLYASAVQDFKDGGEEESLNSQKANNLRLEVKGYEEQRDNLTKKLDAIGEKISSIEADYLNRKILIESEYDKKIENYASSSAQVPTLSKLVDELNIDTFGLSGVVSQADNLVSEAKSQAVKLINKARQDIYSLGDNLYETSSNRAVVNRHNELINDLKSMSKTEFVRSAMTAVNGSGVSAITTILSGALNSAITQDICGEVSCSTPDKEYFVGLVAKKRDFKAPRAPEFEHYPSPRDIVHFDATDYKNIEKTSDGFISKEAILGYGGDIPEIWKLILSENAFVEKGVNLGSFLEQGGEAKYLLRGTLYPCRLGKYAIDINASKVDLSQTSGQYLVSKSVSSKMPTCQDISLKGSLYYTVTDKELNKSVSAGLQETVPSVSPSELGTLLSYEDQRLGFNKASRNVYDRMLDLEDEANSENFDFEVRDNVYQKSMYSNNQIGNFLHFVDKENSVRKNLDELTLSINNARETIKELLSSMNFKISDNFNLANEEEYNYIRNRLLKYKNNLVGQAASKISNVNTVNEVVKERYEKVNNTRAALIQDYDALVNIDTSTVAGSELEESIITERANQEVMSQSQDQALSGIKDEINNYEIPMCMAY